MAKTQRPRLARARAYYRIAAKARRNDDFRGGDRYQAIADRLVAEDRRDREHTKARAEAKAKWLKERNQ